MPVANSNTLTLTILVDDKGSIKVKQFAGEVDKAARDMGAAGEKAGKSVEASAGRINTAFSLMKGALVLAIGREIYQTYGMLVELASGYEETANKFNVVFAGQVASATRAADMLVNHYAMTRKESRQYMSSIQDLLVPMGLQRDLAAALSTEVVKLSADLGSFNNVPTAQVMADVQSALVGNYETMKKYGVVLNEATVQQQALSLGISKSKGDLSAGEKAYAAFSLIVKDSAAAVGDLARTSGGYANQKKQFVAAIEDVGTAFGEALLPTANATLAVLKDIAVELRNILNPDTLEKLKQIQRGADNAASISQHPLYAAFSGDTGSLTDAGRRQRELYKFRAQEALAAERWAADQASAGVGKIGLPEVGAGDFAKRPKSAQELMEEALKKYKEDYGGSGAGGGWSYTWENDHLDRQRSRVLAAGGYSDYLRQMDAKSYESDAARARDVSQYYEDVRLNIRRIEAEYQRTTGVMTSLSQRTAEAMEQSFGDLFFDAFTGKLRTAEDYFRAFTDTLGRIWADLMGQMAKEALFGKGAGGGGAAIGGLFGDLAKWIGGSGTNLSPMSQETALGLVRSAHGNVFGPAGVVPFARGGVVTRPTLFPFANGGVGLMGEAGWEGILPLGRNSRGELGVKSAEGGGRGGDTINVFHITATDTQSFVDAMERSGAVPVLAARDIVGNGVLRHAIVEGL